MSDTAWEPVVETVTGIRKIDREEWNSLLGEGDSPFVDWDWLYAMEVSGSATRRTGWAPSHLVIRNRNRHIIAACPLYLKTHSNGEFVFDHQWAEAAQGAGIRYYPKLLVGVPFTPHTGRRILTGQGADRSALIARLGRALLSICVENDFSSLHVNFCRPDEVEELRKLGFLERFGYQYHWQNNGGLADFDDYLGQLKHKRRHAVKRERAALKDQEIEIRVMVKDEIPDSLFRTMFMIYRSTIEKFYWGRQYLTAEFFDLMRTRFRRHLCFVCAYRRGELVAGTFNVQKGDALYGRYWGCFDELRFLHFNVCYYSAIEHCIRAGITRFEPGAGGEYKWLRGFDPAFTYSMHFISHPALRAAIARYLGRERREVQKWIEAGSARSQLKAPLPSNSETHDPGKKEPSP